VVVGLTLVFLVGPLTAAIWFTRPVEVAATESPATAKTSPHANAEQFLPWTSQADLREPVRSVSESEPVAADILPPPLPPPPLPKEVVAEPPPNRPEVVKEASAESQSTKAVTQPGRQLAAPLKSWEALTPEQHRYLLRSTVPELNLTDGEEWTQALKKRAYPESWNKLTSTGLHTPVWFADVPKRADLSGLPVRMGADCQVDPQTAYNMTQMSRALRAALDRSPGIVMTGSRSPINSPSESDLMTALSRYRDDRSANTVGMLMQMLQVESFYSRLKLVDTLSSIPGEAASSALARLAIFNLEPDVRKAALLALATRPKAEYFDVLLAGFRHPWPPVAENAACAALQLDLRELALRLSDMLDLPDPSAPFLNANNQWVQKKLVRISHLRNCFLCHAASTTDDDPIRGFVPVPGAMIRQYYQSQKGHFVRADVTYLRQDFSAVLPAPNPGRWPTEQRFDFLVVTHELTANEAKGLSVRQTPESTSYPQREAVLTALRHLTGADAGSSAEEWRRLLWRKELHSSSAQSAGRKGLLAARIHRTASRR
jgi:hypothetical protein